MNIKHIGIFGRRNTGKSSLINRLLGQELAIVSDEAGTTTDPVRKRMEIPGVGPVQLIDTAGVDDVGEVGEKRVAGTLKVIDEVDMAILVIVSNIVGKEEKELLGRFKENGLPVVVVHNQSDVVPLDCGVAGDLNNMYDCDVVEFSCKIEDLQEQRDAVEMLMAFITKGLLLQDGDRAVMQGLVEKGDNFVLVCPIDLEAPQGRLILPQVMAIRDILDNGGVATVLQPEQLEGFMRQTGAYVEDEADEADGVHVVDEADEAYVDNGVDETCGADGAGVEDVEDVEDEADEAGKRCPDGEQDGMDGRRDRAVSPVKMVITDSQVFGKVAAIVPQHIPLTSFSVLMARAKGPFEEYLKGAAAIDTLKDGDNVLVLESCTHHTSCEDIGRVKIPAMLQKKCGCRLNFTFVSGLDELPPLEGFSLVLQCGGCMVSRRQLCNRIRKVVAAGIPVTNYGMCIAYVTGIFNRAVRLPLQTL